MNIFLCGINAKYIHTNIAIRQIKGYIESRTDYKINLLEFTINNYVDDIIQKIYKCKPDLIGFSCYLWNIEFVSKLCVLIKKLLPETKIILGGPEVTYTPAKTMKNIPCDYVISGEGELATLLLVRALHDNTPLENVGNLTFLKDGQAITNEKMCGLDMGKLPFPYSDFSETKNKICYYEASRGCPFNCKYCLSSIEKGVRFAPIEKVFKELKIFLENKVPQVKFVDRTFNSNKKFALQIINFLIENDNGITNFHFEVEASLLDDDIILALNSARKELFQLEIGVQSTNIQTLNEISRTGEFSYLSSCVNKLLKPQNIHVHLDLIAGLPLENIDSFERSFNDVHELMPHQLQLGFLKILKGSAMEKMCETHAMKYSPYPPFEVLCTDCLSYDDIIILKGVCDMVEIYYNTNRYRYTINYLSQFFDGYFKMYLALYNYKKEKSIDSLVHNKQQSYAFIINFAKDKLPSCDIKLLLCIVKLDFLLHEKPRSLPLWCEECANLIGKDEIFNLVVNENALRNLNGYEDCNSNRILKLVHVEKFPLNPLTHEDIPCTLAFDYENRNLWGNATTIQIV